MNGPLWIFLQKHFLTNPLSEIFGSHWNLIRFTDSRRFHKNAFLKHHIKFLK